MKIRKLVPHALLLLSLLTSAAPAARAEEPSAPAPLEGISLRDLRLIPVQSGGRIKPFDEFARELLLVFTGNRSYPKFDPSELIVSIMVNPAAWANVPLIRVGNEETRKQLLLPADRKFFTPEELSKNNAFLQYAEGMGQDNGSQVTASGVSPVTAAMDPRAEELKRVVDRMTRFQALVGGHLWTTTPPADKNPDTEWAPLSQGMKQPTETSNAVYALLKAYLDRNPEAFNQSASQARLAIETATPKFDEIKTHLIAEVYYNRLRPFFQALLMYFLAGVLWLFAADRVPGQPPQRSLIRLLAKFMTFGALLLHIVGFALRCYVAGRPPVTNMYESIIWVSLLCMIFALIIYAKTRARVLITSATILSGITLFAADAAPLLMDPTIRPLVPVLRSNYWLTVHVLTITASYAAFMLAMGIANITLWHFFRKAGGRPDVPGGMPTTQKIFNLNQLTYRALMFGTVLLAAGTILGGIWADYSWGRFWGWDPKEVWALIALLAYMAMLHGRLTGWVGNFGFPLWTTICFSTVIMAWYGVNFVLGVGLHSYGFSSGGQAVMAGFVTVQILWCLLVASRVKGASGKPAAPAV